MVPICIVTGTALVAVGIALFRIRQPNWKDEGDLVEHHRVAIERWSKVQLYVRSINNCLVILIGTLIFASAFLDRGRKIWGICWLVILALLMVCIILAMIDALSSFAGYRRALPEAARRSFSDPNRKNSRSGKDEFPDELPK